jgi:membrane protein EpsK
MFRRERLRSLFSMGWWVVLNQIGAILFYKVGLVVVNRVLGPDVAGRYSTVLLFSIMLQSLAGVAANVLPPVVYARFALGDRRGIAQLATVAVTVMGLVMSLPVGLLCGLATPILRVWLGPEFAELAPLMLALVGHLGVNMAVLPLFAVTQAYNKVRWPGIITLVMGGANVLLAVLLAGIPVLGPLGVALAGMIVLTAKNVLFTPIYTARIQGLSWWIFLPPVGTAALATIITATVSHALATLMNTGSWRGLILVSTCVSVAYAMIAYGVLASRSGAGVLRKLFTHKVA